MINGYNKLGTNSPRYDNKVRKHQQLEVQSMHVQFISIFHSLVSTAVTSISQCH